MTVAIDLAFGAGPMVFGLLAAVGGIPAAFLAGAALAVAGAIGASISARRVAVVAA